MAAYPVSSRVNKTDIDDGQLIEPVPRWPEDRIPKKISGFCFFFACTPARRIPFQTLVIACQGPLGKMGKISQVSNRTLCRAQLT